MAILKRLAQLIADDQTRTPRRSMAQVAAVGASMLVAVLLVGWFAFNVVFQKRVRYELHASELGPPNGLRVKIHPRTFNVESRQAFSLQARDDFDETCDHVRAKISDQSWEHTFTRAELLNGVRSNWNPSHTGTYSMQFFCRENLIGETTVSVVIRPTGNTRFVMRSKAKPKPVRWVLKNGNPIYREGSFFEIPVMVGAEVESSPSSFVPLMVDHDTQFRLLDHNGQISNLKPLVIHRHSAISEPIYVPFHMAADYRLTAYEKEKGQSSNELKLAWKELAPSLSLSAWPPNIELYSAGLSSSSVQLYLMHDARRIRPSETTDVLVNAPSIFSSDPTGPVPISPTQPIGVYRLSAPTTSGNWKIEFNAPQLGISAGTAVTVLSTRNFVLLALVFGLAGVLVARNKDLFAQTPLAIVLEILTTLFAVLLLYGLLLTGWIPLPVNPQFILSYWGALVIGLVAGFSGMAVFQVAKRALLPLAQ